MINFNRPTDPGKSPLKPAFYEPPGSGARGVASTPARPVSPQPAPAREAPAPAAAATSEGARQAAAPAPTQPPSTVPTEVPGSKLFVGANIKLKGVEITDCDILVIEGQVEATVHSKLMQVAAPGALKGTAVIDVAEIHGEFSGELTARTRLIVHGTGRVCGTIRYGQLVVEEGGEISGDVKRHDASTARTHPSASPADSSRSGARPT